MIFLRHPVHGEKHAYLESEAATDEKNGWVRVAALVPSPEKPVEKVTEIRPKLGLPKGRAA